MKFHSTRHISRRISRSSLFALLLGLSLALAPALLPDTAQARKGPGPEEGFYGPAAGPGPMPQGPGGYVGPGPDFGGYDGPGPDLTTVREASAMGDGAWVALKGTITHSLGDRDYMFEDPTGSIEIKIGPKEWMGQRVSDTDTVEIHGRVKKDWSRVHVDVRRLIKR